MAGRPPQDLFVVIHRVPGGAGDACAEAVWAANPGEAASGLMARGLEVLESRAASYAERCAVGQTGSLGPLARCPRCGYPFDGLKPVRGSLTCPECGLALESPGTSVSR